MGISLVSHSFRVAMLTRLLPGAALPSQPGWCFRAHLQTPSSLFTLSPPSLSTPQSTLSLFSAVERLVLNAPADWAIHYV